MFIVSYDFVTRSLNKCVYIKNICINVVKLCLCCLQYIEFMDTSKLIHIQILFLVKFIHLSTFYSYSIIRIIYRLKIPYSEFIINPPFCLEVENDNRYHCPLVIGALYIFFSSAKKKILNR